MNSFEREFKKLLESKGWKLFRKGWPDYAAVSPKGEKVFFELKDRYDTVSKQQAKMHEFLESTGIPVYVVAGKKLKEKLYLLYRTKNLHATFASFKIIRSLQEGPLIIQHISKKVHLSPQLVDYHLKKLANSCIVVRTEDGKYRLADDYATDEQLKIIGKLKPFIDDVRSRAKNDEETIEKAVNYFLVFLSNLFFASED